MTDQLAKKLGYNESVIHVDMISTADRTVTANLADGRELVIYRKGEFTI
jgi:aminopeptidase